VLLDAQARLREINPVARELLGATQFGEPWADIESRVFQPGFSGAGERPLLDGRTCVITERALDQTPGRILVLQDVTEARSLQERLERQQRLSAMGEMAAKLAHQIRTPLSSALLYVGHLARTDLDAAQREKFAGRLRERLQHMERQANDILAFSRGHSAHFEPLDISPLIGNTVRLVQPLAADRGAHLSLTDRSGGGACVVGNPDALQGAFANLISNALEHGGAGVRVRVDVARTVNGWVLLRFMDDGPGVPGDIRSQIFDPFFTTRSDGTGLGLAVVQSVVLAHRGRVRLDDRETDGTCFEIELPIEGGSGEQKAPPQRSTA
jgi:two-component system sensor histidine kinase FlrB